MTVIRLVVYFLLVTVGELTGQAVLWDRSTQQVCRRAVLVNESEFRKDALVQMAKAMLNEKKTHQIVDIQFYTRTDQMRLFMRLSGTPFEVWKRDQQEAATIDWQVAQLIAFNNDSVLRVRKGNEIDRVVIGSADPLVYDLSGIKFEVVHIAFTSLALHPIKAFVRASDLNVKASLEFLRVLEQKSGLRIPYLAVRKDSWFMGDDDFPAYYLFGQTELRTFSEYNMAPEVVCANYGRGLECHGARLPEGRIRGEYQRP